MSGVTKAVDWMGEHPLIVGIGVFAIGGLVLLSLSKGGGSGNGMAAFYAAQSAQQASNNAVALAQVQGQTTVDIAKLAASTKVATSADALQLGLANAGAGLQLGLAQNTTAQQAQKQQFFLDVGVQQIEGAIAPYIMHDPNAASIFANFNAAGTGYTAAH